LIANLESVVKDLHLTNANMIAFFSARIFEEIKLIANQELVF
jgi:hypothetical protein